MLSKQLEVSLEIGGGGEAPTPYFQGVSLYSCVPLIDNYHNNKLDYICQVLCD